jgi:hypothetical protein
MRHSSLPWLHLFEVLVRQADAYADRGERWPGVDPDLHDQAERTAA